MLLTAFGWYGAAPYLNTMDIDDLIAEMSEEEILALLAIATGEEADAGSLQRLARRRLLHEGGGLTDDGYDVSNRLLELCLLTADPDALNMTTVTTPEGDLKEQADHYFVCNACGEAVDRRLLGDVMHHAKPGHSRLRTLH